MLGCSISAVTICRAVNNPNKDIIVPKLTIQQTVSGFNVSDLWATQEVSGSTGYRGGNCLDFIQSTHADTFMALKMKTRPLLLGRVLTMVHAI